MTFLQTWGTDVGTTRMIPKFPEHICSPSHHTVTPHYFRSVQILSSFVH